MKRILVVYGTRPEAIKMAPVVSALAATADLSPVVAVTGQHRAMLDQVNDLFGIVPEHDLNIISARQSLEQITTRALQGMAGVISAESPDLVLVQGDTTTCFAAALAGFYAQVPVAHLEAGLRTGNLYNPFPEEANRRLTTQLTAIHFAPTPVSRDNLLNEGVERARIYVTGNTVIDALLSVVSRRLPLENAAIGVAENRRTVLITTHRRESWGAPMERTARAIARLAHRYPETVFLLPAHLNPLVRDILVPALSGFENVLITEPLSYGDMAWAINNSSIVLTDSGGVQEEAPSLGKPVLVMRETTERPEAVNSGTVRLVGTDEELIVDQATQLLDNPAAYSEMARAVNPYGDGMAAERVVGAIRNFFGTGGRPAEFMPVADALDDIAADPAAVAVASN